MIRIEHISKKYNDRVIFSDFSYRIAPGDFVVITGSSGVGKSTLLNLIGNLESADKGSIYVDNVRLKKRPNVRLYRNKISYLFQNFGLIENSTVFDNLYMSLNYVRKDRKEKNIMMMNALSDVGLESALNQPVYTLSGGEKQRLALAKVMLKPSKIILADEPTGNLDDENAVHVFNILHKIHDQHHKTIVVVTHNKELIRNDDRVLQL